MYEVFNCICFYIHKKFKHLQLYHKHLKALAEGCQCFTCPYCLHLHGQRKSQESSKKEQTLLALYLQAWDIV